MSKLIAALVVIVLVIAGAAVYVDLSGKGNGDDPSDPKYEVVTNEILNITGKSYDNGVVSYKGIPYAEAPVGELRFAPPVEKEAWTEVLDCTEYRSCAIQAEGSSTVGVTPSEDCLYLNIWAPADAKEGDKLPVFFWIHGGAFYNGAGSIYDCTEFAKNGIVAVSINYRLGALGYLALDTLMDQYGTTGNWGTLDQIMALQWVNDNISAVGGDSSNITIAGESAGGFSVSHLIFSDLTNGMFQKAILESGTVLSDEYIVRLTDSGLDSNITMSQMFAAKFGADDSEEGLKILRSVDPMTLWTLGYFEKSSMSDSYFTFWPVLDGSVLPVDPLASIEHVASQKNITILEGYNLYDGNSFVSESDIIGESSFTAFVYDAFEGEKAEKILDLYKDDTRSLYERVAEIVGMGYFYLGANQMWNGFSEAGIDVYAYEFCYTSSEGKYPIHADEIYFAFGNIADHYENPSDADYRMQAQIHGMWCNFIKTGNPNGEGLPSSAVWEKYSEAESKVFYFDNECEFDVVKNKELIDKLLEIIE